MSFDFSWDTLAVLKGGMRIHYSGAYPTRDSGCTELLPHVVVFNWNKQARLPFLNSGSSVMYLCWYLSALTYWAVRAPKSGLPVRIAGLYHGSLT